jgi:gluconolactonase
MLVGSPPVAYQIQLFRFSTGVSISTRIALATVDRAATGLSWAEGPVWLGDMRLMIFSDIQNNRMMKWDEQTGQLSVFRNPSGHSNGNVSDREGRLLTCEHELRRVTRTEHNGAITVVADKYDGKPLNSPNDIICKSDGTIWFTDPAFGPNPLEAMASPELPGTVYRLDPQTKQLTAPATDIRGPNGLAFSPDESKLYVVEARATPNRLILAYDVAENGTKLANKRTFFDSGTGTPDGFRVDADGNLWCGWGMSQEEDGVLVIAPDGKPIGHIHLPERCPNLVFGGLNRNRLLMCTKQSIYALYVNARGAV